MRLTICALIVIAGLPLLSSAQHPKRFVQAELLKTIKAKNAKPGDPVKARTVSDVTLSGGVSVPAGTLLLGEVRAASPTSLTISFNRAELGGKPAPLVLSIRAVMMPGELSKGMAGEERTSLDAATPDAHPINGGPVQLSEKTENAAQNSPGSSSSSPGSERPVTAQTGSVIGMPGITLHVDMPPDHAAKFETGGKDLQLKQGLQLMLAPLE